MFYWSIGDAPETYIKSRLKKETQRTCAFFFFFGAFNNPAHVRSKRNLFQWGDSFLKLLKTQRKQLSSSATFSNRREKFPLPLRYTTKNVKIKSTKCTFRLDSTKRNYILTAVSPWQCSSSTLPCSWKVLLHAISVRLVWAGSLPASTHHPTDRNDSGSSIIRVYQVSWGAGEVGTL